MVVGSKIHDYVSHRNNPPGHIRAYDVRTGELKWRFHTIPQEGEPYTETWGDESWRWQGNTNAWTMLAADEELGYVYIPLSTPTNDYYGGERVGDNLFAESIVCLDVETGERVWHFQTVHHGIWDYDIGSAPNVMDIVVDGKPIQGAGASLEDRVRLRLRPRHRRAGLAHRGAPGAAEPGTRRGLVAHAAVPRRSRRPSTARARPRTTSSTSRRNCAPRRLRSPPG